MIDDLVQRLINHSQNIQLEARINNPEETQKRIRNGFVFIDFLDTTGTTELGINVDAGSVIDQDQNLKFSGSCELNFHKIRCHAEVNKASFLGSAKVELI